MTSKQRMAITYPCVEAWETTHDRYKTLVGRWSTILTLNCGFE